MKTIKLTILLIIITLLNSCECKNEYKIPKGLISQETANNYEETYKANQFKAINDFLSNDGIKRTDHRDIWFSLDEIENYIRYVKEKSKEQDLENLGLRVYFGAKLDADGKSKSTVFFVPTHREINRGDSDNINNNKIKALNFGNAGMPPNDYVGGD